MNKIKLYTFYSKDFLPLKRRFSRTLRDNFDVEYILFVKDKVSKGTGGGYQTWVYKTNLLIELIEKNFGELIIFSDIDIQFFKKIEPIIKESLDKYDIVFQGEKKFTNVNIGFMACRCNKEVLDFWKQVLRIVKDEKLWDQKVVNDLLLSGNKLKWGYFPKSIWNWYMTPGWKSIALHHSIGAGDLRTKLFQMRIVSFVYYLKFINKFDVTYRISRKIYNAYKHYRKLTNSN